MAKRKTEAKEEKPVKKPFKAIPETQYSICVPSTIISSANARNLEQITFIAYQIAKAATIYNVAEIVVLDVPSSSKKQELAEKEATKVVELGSNKGGKKIKFNFSDEEIVKPGVEETKKDETPKDLSSDLNENNTLLFATLLQYFMTPPYLVKSVFANNQFSTKFKYAQKLPKISTLPFMSNNDVSKDFKEGLTIPKATPKITKKNKKVSALKKLSVTKYVNIGDSEPFVLDQEVPVNVRVTVDLKNKKIVSPLQAYGLIGCKLSFGYHVRYCASFSSIFTQSSFPEGYTSTVYVNCDDYFNSNDTIESRNSINKNPDLSSKDGKVLLLFGNYNDLDYSFQNDKANLPGVENVSQIFDGELPIPKGVKIEDATLISLAKVYS
mmetsp:Transcript_7933/g.9994  ORF Transcript_7933/g.9994 Transcript_7933/m.9994 type:complete len:382 (+) Transcript_7933:147-1292(+)